MERLKTITIIFLLAIGLLVPAALAKHPSVLLREGLYAEETEGDLDAAIKVYERVLKDFPKNRPVAAKALLHIGLCYEKLGKQEAQKAYRRLIKEFADQPEPVQTARRHLEQLDTGAPGARANGPTYRLVLDEKITGILLRWSDFSPSGDRIVFVGQNKLYIADQTGTVIRPLLDNFAPWKDVGWPHWSPDGRLIVYRLSRALPADSGTPDDISSAIFVLNPDGGAPRQIGPDVRGRIRGGAFWTPDSRRLSYWARDGLHTFTLDGNKVRFIPKKDLPDVLPWHCGYSPNGRWVVSNRMKENATHRYDTDICIIPATGGTVRRLTHLPGARQATWAPDGRTLYFVSGKDDTLNIWKLPMDPETGLAKGQPQQVTFFKDAIVLKPKVLGDGSRIGFSMFKQNTFIQVADASTPHEARTLVRSGKYSPELSPDGQTVYYVNDTPGEKGIYAVPRQGGAPRRLTESLPAETSHSHLPRFDISPDGQTLAYVTQSSDGKGLFTLPVSGGEPRLLVKFDRRLAVVPQWSPDGSQLAYTAGEGLYVIPATAGQPRELAHLGWWEGWTVRWSPDGKSIAALGRPKPKSANAVYVVPASGGKLRQLTPDVEYKEGLEWHPDGKRLTYHVSRYASETRQAYLDGRPPSVLFNIPDMWDYVGTWAPDSRRFFFMADEVPGMPGWGTYVYDESSGKTTLVSDPVDDVGVPCWSRDGKTMAWWATRRTSMQTWVMENFLPKSTAGK